METSACYQIRIRGQLDPSWSEWLGGLEITSYTNGDTFLTGNLVDQSALQAVIDKLFDLNLTLMSVSRDDPPTAGR